MATRVRRKRELGMVRLSDCPVPADAEIERVVRALARTAAEILAGQGELMLAPDMIMNHVRLRPRVRGGKR